MGWKLARYEFCGRNTLKAHEERDIDIVLVEEKKAAIHGVVRFPNGRPVKNAVVKLFQKCGDDPCKLKPITFCFTDDCGQFLFGVPCGIEFIIKVFFFKPEQHHHHKECEEDMYCRVPKKRKVKRQCAPKYEESFMDCEEDDYCDGYDYEHNYIYEDDDCDC